MRTVFSIGILLALLGFLVAQPAQSVVQVKVLSAVDKLQKGTTHRFAVELTIQSPYHINSHKPAEDFLIPTKVTLEPVKGVSFGELKYPEGISKQFSFSEVPLNVYEGTVYILGTMTIAPDYPGREVELRGTVEFQACDDHTCLAPEEMTFSQTFSVVEPGEAVQSIHPEIFSPAKTSAPAAKSEAVSPTAGEENPFQGKGFLLTLALVFLGGLALNLTPCVYPLIPITISYFGGQAGEKKGSLLTHAIIYVLGMAVTYSILGVIAALTGSLFGAALQNPIVLIALAVILVGLSLSMFDLYEIRVPAFLSNFAGGARQGLFGTLFMGLTVGIVAAPCIGPFVLALLTYVGEQGNIFLGFILFFVLAIGLGIPFIFLAIFSGSLSRMPRSGAWMVWVRSIFGFVLIAMAIYFLHPLFPNDLFYYLALAFTMLVGGVYMAWIEPTPSQGKVFPVIRNLVGVIFFVIALVFTTTGVQTYVDQKLEHLEASGSAAAPVAEKIQWFPYSQEMLQKAAAEGKPVMIDFYADWCIPCKELDKFTFSQPEVIELSRNMIMLKVDLTKGNSPQAKELKKKYNIRGVPTLVFLTPDGQELNDLRVVGFMEKEEFLPRMQKALEYARK